MKVESRRLVTRKRRGRDVAGVLCVTRLNMVGVAVMVVVVQAG